MQEYELRFCAPLPMIHHHHPRISLACVNIHLLSDIKVAKTEQSNWLA